MKTILLSTRNRHKLEEVAAILGPAYEVLGLDRIPDFPEVEETGATFEANASLKAEAASRHFEGLVLADDSGLEVDALGGEPGVLSARYAGTHGDDAANNALLLQRLRAFRGRERSARFRCALAVAQRGETLQTFSGAVEGIIINEPKGSEGFGYDPLFVPEGCCETFGQLPSSIKNGLSHRARALEQLLVWLATVQ